MRGTAPAPFPWHPRSSIPLASHWHPLAFDSTSPIVAPFSHYPLGYFYA